jgi:hypothetical protein
MARTSNLVLISKRHSNVVRRERQTFASRRCDSTHRTANMPTTEQLDSAAVKFLKELRKSIPSHSTDWTEIVHDQEMPHLTTRDVFVLGNPFLQTQIRFLRTQSIRTHSQIYGPKSVY